MGKFEAGKEGGQNTLGSAEALDGGQCVTAIALAIYKGELTPQEASQQFKDMGATPQQEGANKQRWVVDCPNCKNKGEFVTSRIKATTVKVGREVEIPSFALQIPAADICLDRAAAIEYEKLSS